jgi:acetolactate synthase regulatory subunit
MQVRGKNGKQTRRKNEEMQETTITIEFTTETEQHLKTLEHQLKHIHDVGVELVEPKDSQAPALLAVGIDKGGERGERAAQAVAEVLHSFLHEDTQGQGPRTISLVTIEGERIDIAPLSVEAIRDIIVASQEGE